MKLRNKKTGEVGEAHWVSFREDRTDLCISMYKDGAYYEVHSLAELNEEWEDYKPAEPLIKDEKVRKAVRAWAEACGVDDADIVRHYGTGGWLGLRYENPNTGWVCKFEVEGFGSGNQLNNGKTYTIAELCGEGEE